MRQVTRTWVCTCGTLNTITEPLGQPHCRDCGRQAIPWDFRSQAPPSPADPPLDWPVSRTAVDGGAGAHDPGVYPRRWRCGECSAENEHGWTCSSCGGVDASIYESAARRRAEQERVLQAQQARQQALDQARQQAETVRQQVGQQALLHAMEQERQQFAQQAPQRAMDADSTPIRSPVPRQSDQPFHGFPITPR